MFPRSDRCLRPPKAPPSRRILLSATIFFPLSGERPLSFTISKLELILSYPFHTGAAGPHTRHRRPSDLPPRRRTPLSRAPLLPPRRPIVQVRATPARLARHHPKCHWCSWGAPRRRLATVGPSANMPPRRPARGDHAAEAHCASRDRVCTQDAAQLDRAARPRPSRLVSRLHVAGRHVSRDVTRGQLLAQYCAVDLIVFPIVLISEIVSYFKNS
jgi:hypothetical protein